MTSDKARVTNRFSSLVTRHSSLFFRLGVAASLLLYTLWRSHPRDVWVVARGTMVVPLLTAVGLVFLDRALMAWRWFALLRPLERHTLPTFGTILRIFFVSTFLGTFLPGSIGGDAVRAYSLSRHQVPAGGAVASVFLDRMLGVLSLLLMTPVGLVLARDLGGNYGIMLALAFTSLGCVATAVVIFSPRAEARAAELLQRVPWAGLRRFGHTLIESLRGYSVYRRDLILVLVASIAVQILRVTQAYFLGISLGIDQPMRAYLMFVPLILLIMLLPITVNGIGTSQAAFVWLFGRAGTPNAEAFALSILFVALGIVGNLPGAFVYATEPARQG